MPLLTAMGIIISPLTDFIIITPTDSLKNSEMFLPCLRKQTEMLTEPINPLFTGIECKGFQVV